MRELAKLRALTGAEWRLLIAAGAAMPLVASGVSVLGFRRLHAVLARWPRPRSARFATPPARSARAQSIAKIVAIAAFRGPVRASCLRRSLLLWWLLRRDGIERSCGGAATGEGGRCPPTHGSSPRAVPRTTP